MSGQKPAVGQDVVYYAEGQPYSGPFPARIIALGPEPESEAGPPQTVDLEVWFSSERAHAKTSVKFADQPTKHHWGWPPPAPPPAQE